jgi:polar amino acid transport system substrate-binding protein
VQFGVGVPENDSDWRDRINIALQSLWRSGEFQEIYERWFVGPERQVDLPLGGEMELWPS